MKPTAKIRLWAGSLPLQVGLPAIGMVLDHPSQRQFKGPYQRTSAIVKINSNGSFETQNTRYEVVG